MSASSDRVTLKGGLTVPIDVVTTLISLEDRGLHFTLADDGALTVGPRGALTDDDRDFIRTHKADIVAIVSYIARLPPC